MILSRRPTVGSYTLTSSVTQKPKLQEILTNHCFHFCCLLLMLSVPLYSTLNSAPKLLSNVVAPKLMLLKNPLRVSQC
ncbi:hypothetical protein ACOSQ2_002413 [Xanthoceras sorbifolium]